MSTAKFALLALVASPALSDQFSVAGNVEVVRLCLSADDYLSALVNAIYLVGESIQLSDSEEIRKRVVAEVDATGLAEDYRLFSYVAGPKALLNVGGDGIALRALAFDMVTCASHACKDADTAAELSNHAMNVKDQLVMACVQDFRGQR